MTLSTYKSKNFIFSFISYFTSETIKYFCIMCTSAAELSDSTIKQLVTQFTAVSLMLCTMDLVVRISFLRFLWFFYLHNLLTMFQY